MSLFLALLKEAIHFGAVFLYGSTGETVVEKSGHLNLGIPGIMCLGGVGGCMGAYWAYQGGCNPFVVVLSAVLMAMLFGGAGGLLYGVFTITMRCNQNVTGLTLTTFGAGVLGFWKTQMGDNEINFSPASAFAFWSPDKEGAGWFYNVFLSHGALVYLAIAIAIVVAVYIKFTRGGLSLRAVGENPAAADAAGINVIAHKYVACVLGAAIAGIGGAFYLLDCTQGSLENTVDALGWLAVALVIFSLWRPGIGIFGSIVFGFLYILPQHIDVGMEIKELLMVIPYGVTALVLIVISFFKKRETQPPAALGLPYFREDR